MQASRTIDSVLQRGLQTLDIIAREGRLFTLNSSKVLTSMGDARQGSDCKELPVCRTARPTLKCYYLGPSITSNRRMSPYRLSRSSQTAPKRSTFRLYFMNPARLLLSTVFPNLASANTFMSFCSPPGRPVSRQACSKSKPL